MSYKRKVKGSKLGISRSLQKHLLVIYVLLQTLFKIILLFQNFVYSFLLLIFEVDLFSNDVVFILNMLQLFIGTKNYKLQYILALSPLPDPRDCHFFIICVFKIETQFICQNSSAIEIVLYSLECILEKHTLNKVSLKSI